MTTLLIGLILTVGLVTIVYVDRYFSQRRSAMVNAGFARRIENGRADSRLHLVGYENRMSTSRPAFHYGPEVEVKGPGFFGRRREVVDSFGRVVGTHYEELRFKRERLLLTA